MTRRRWAAMASGILLVSVVVGGLAPETLRAQVKTPAGAPADASASPAKFQAVMADWKSKVIPAAKKEGEVIWYSCAQATEAEGTIKAFNKAYRDIQVSQVLGPGYQLVEKISTEVAAAACRRTSTSAVGRAVGPSRGGGSAKSSCRRRRSTRA